LLTKNHPAAPSVVVQQPNEKAYQETTFPAPGPATGILSAGHPAGEAAFRPDPDLYGGGFHLSVYRLHQGAHVPGQAPEERLPGRSVCGAGSRTDLLH